MRNCKGCKFANWDKTKTGKLSPTGDGKCTYEVKLPVLPASMYWSSAPHIYGGHIERHGEMKEHCAYYTREENKAS
jgi:hypothetical protein